MTVAFVYKFGRAEVAVPSGSKIAVLTRGTARVYVLQQFPNYPDAVVEQTACVGRQRLYGTFTGDVVVAIETDAEEAYYEVGTAPNVDLLLPFRQVAPATATVAATLTAAQLLTKYISATPTATGATVAYTLPTGTLMDAAVAFEVNDSFDWTCTNLAAAAADTITITAATDHTVVGTMVIQSAHATTGGVSGNAASFRTRKTAANTYVTYRLG